MFNSSLRRAARTCPNATSITSRPTTPLSASITTSAHQRRHSSSKPPVPPNNGSSAIPPASVKHVGAPRAEKRTGAESRLSKRKVPKDKAETKQDFSNEWTLKLPSVPSTQYLNPKGTQSPNYASVLLANRFVRRLRSFFLLNPPTYLDNRAITA